MYLMIPLVLIMLSWQFWLREYHFMRKPKAPDTSDHRKILSPAEGTIVEVGWCTGSPHIIKQRERQFRHDYGLDKEKQYQHISIFMTIFDTHYIADTIPGEVVSLTEFEPSKENLSMMGIFDSILSVIGISFFNWIKRSRSFLLSNQQFVITYDNGIVLIVTMDKYVNMISYTNNVPGFLYFVHKGSQTEVLIPKDLNFDLVVGVGDKVTYSDALVANKKAYLQDLQQ